MVDMQTFTSRNVRKGEVFCTTPSTELSLRIGCGYGVMTRAKQKRNAIASFDAQST